MNKFTIAIVAGIAAASLAISLGIRQRAKLQLQQQDDSWRRQAQALAELTAKNERLSDLISELKSSQPLSRDQLRELLALRNEVGQLRQSGRAKEKLQAANARLHELASTVDRQLAEAQAAPNYWPKDQLSFAGYTDPESAMKSILAAMTKGDVSSWRTSCTPKAIANLENEWTQRGLSQAQEDAEIKAMSDTLISSSAGFHILDQTMPSPDEDIINLSFDGEGKSRKFVLKKMGAEWKFDNLLVAGQDYYPPQ